MRECAKEGLERASRYDVLLPQGQVSQVGAFQSNLRWCMNRHLSVLIVVLLFSCVTGKEFKQHIKPSIPWLFLLWVGLMLGFKPKIKASIVREKYEVSQSTSGQMVRVCRRPGGWRRRVGTTSSGWAFNAYVSQLRKEGCSFFRRLSPLPLSSLALECHQMSDHCHPRVDSSPTAAVSSIRGGNMGGDMYWVFVAGTFSP